MTGRSDAAVVRGRVRDSRLVLLGWAIKQLAERCKPEGLPVSASELSRIERYIHVPRPALRTTSAEVLGLTVMGFVKVAGTRASVGRNAAVS